MPEVPAPAESKFPIRHGILQGNLDCAGFTLINVDLAGFNLDKNSVGLGQVDNTSDLNKPVSIATQAALDLKEDLLPESDAGQFLGDGKMWVNYGAFIFENPATNFEFISVKGANASTSSSLRAGRNDNPAIHTRITHYGASVLGSTAGIPGANVGQLAFIGASYGMIMTDNFAPLIFAVNNTRRMRLTQGLNVGGDSDPGAGCITAFGTITAGSFVGPLGAGVATSLQITGAGGAGWIAFTQAQLSNPPAGCRIFASSVGRIAIQGTLNPNNLSFGTDGLSANRIWTILDENGAVPVRVTALPGGSGATGVSGSIAFDGSFLYVCVAANSWRRVAVAAF